MALIIPKSRLKPRTSIQLLTTVTSVLIVGLLLHLIDANQFRQKAHKHLTTPNEPPLYVIQHEPVYNDNNNNLGHINQNDNNNQQSSLRTRQWNNQKLIVSTNSRDNNNSPFRQAALDEQENYQQAGLLLQNSASSFNRKAKQLVYTDEPVPYYHSYKHIGYAAGLGSSADEYYQPLRKTHHFISSDNVMGALYSNTNQQTPSKRVGAAGSTSTKSKGATASTQTSRKSSSRPTPSKTNSKRRFESPEGPLAVGGSPAGSINRANRNKGRKNLVCYYGTWAVYRPDAGKFPVENIDPFLCTHVIYGFTGLSYDNLIKPLDPWNDLEDNYGKGAMRRFTGLKRQNPDLKTLVAIGGWNEGSIKYSKMASEPESRARFVQSVVEFLKKYDFDGLDLDWEYPGSRGGHSYDKQNFVMLLKELHEAFAPNGFLLTAAVSAGKWFIDPAYDIPQVSRYLDLINLMAYDYHGGWETKTGMNAPLFNSPKHDLTKEESMLNVNWSVNYWLQNGAEREKLMLGVGSYGRSFTLDKAQENGINAPASQKGQAGPYTREPGSLGYNELCESFQRNPNAWTIVRDPDYLAPYAYNDRQWVGYDDVQSLALKAQFAKSMGLGGMMMWSIETDDFLGRCHNGEKYPLLNTIRKVLDSSGPGTIISPNSLPAATTTTPIVNVKPTTGTGTANGRPQQAGSTTTTTTRRPLVVVVTTPNGLEVEEDEVKPSTTSRRPTSPSRRPIKTTTTTTTTTTTKRPNTLQNGDFNCVRDGMFADPRNCRKFVRCVSAYGNGPNYSIYKFDCGPGTAFNEQQQYCDHIYNVPSCNKMAQQNSNVRSFSSTSLLDNQNEFLHSSFAHKHHLQAQSRLLGFWPPY